MLELLLESALRLLALGGIVWLILKLPRFRNPQVQMTAWTVVLLASLSMPVLMRFATAGRFRQARGRVGPPIRGDAPLGRDA
jgi:hypothetical protein